MNRPATKFAALGFATIALTVLTVSSPARDSERRATSPPTTVVRANALSAQQTPRTPVVLENKFLRISVDAHTGAIVDITNRKSHLAYMARTSVAKPPFIVNAYSANQAVFIRDEFEKQSGGYSLYDPAAPAVKGDLSSLREPVPGSTEVTEESTPAFRRVWCRYLLPGGIAVRYSITIRPGSPLTDWRIFVDNRGGETPAKDQRVYRVAFPVLDGLRIGGAHENNFLARPYAQGELIPDPAAYEYRRPTRSATPTNILTYIGWASMPWQDLYSKEGGGLYLVSHDPSFEQLDLETWPDRSSGTVTLAMRTLAFLDPGQSWESQQFVVGIHEGDWHWAADRYREWAHAHLRPFTGPDWVRSDCDGWLGTGGPTNVYGDYLGMYDDARWLGLNYLQIWSEMLENVGPGKSRKGYYCFLWPDPDRGGEAELTRVVRAIRNAGGHIGFYHNIWTWDSELKQGLQQWRNDLPSDVHVPNWWGEARGWASVFPDGSRQAGNFTEGYAGMCPAAKGYQDYVLSWVVDRYIKRYGVDTWYFDSMPVTMFAASRICFSSEHGPRQPHGVGRGMLELLGRVHDASQPFVNLAITSETASDALMQFNSHALGLELVDGLTRSPHPEIYTYTFPEHAIFSGTCDGAGSALKYYYPDLEKPRREDTMNRVFLMGYRFDILAYPVNRQDPFMQYLKQLIALRQRIKDQLYASDFRDEIGLGPMPAKVYAKVFRHRQAKSLTVTLIDRRAALRKPFELTLDLSVHDVGSANKVILYELGGAARPLATKQQGRKLTLQVPSLVGEAAAIVIGL
ncbi:MAG: DUF6259 domain-containing protein [Terriglobia bacterium]